MHDSELWRTSRIYVRPIAIHIVHKIYCKNYFFTWTYSICRHYNSVIFPSRYSNALQNDIIIKRTVNAGKTSCMVLGTHHSTRKFIDINQDTDLLNDSEPTSSKTAEKVKLYIKLGGVSLNRVSSTKFPVVIIDENLTWKNPIDAILNTISRSIWMLTKLKHLYSLYCTLIILNINKRLHTGYKRKTCTIYLNNRNGLSERCQIAHYISLCDAIISYNTTQTSFQRWSLWESS